MKKILSSLIIIAISALNYTYGVPASNRVVEITQPDGTTLSIIQYGNEYDSFKTTVDGYTIVKNANGVFEYIYENNSLTYNSGIKANNPTQRTEEEIHFLTKVSKYIKPVIHTKSVSIRPKYQYGTFPTTGNHKYLLILVKFSDTDTTFSRSNFVDFMNTEGGATGKGSFRQYYSENSYNQLNITTTVTQWLTLPKPRAYYAENLWDNILEFAYESVRLADSAGIDFSEYDNNNDGLVDGIAIIHTGEGQEDSGNPADIWSHAWNIADGNYTENERTFDNVVVDKYTVQPEMLGAGISSIAVIAHEFGHILGAQDYYDVYNGANSIYKGTAKWDLMGFGAWNGNPIGSDPAHHNIYQKEQFGWLKLQELKTDTTYSLKNSAKYTEGLIMSTAKQGEYYVFENKQKTGFDRGIPGHGLLVYHIDENYITEQWWNNEINISAHQGIYVKPASGEVNSASATFPGSANVTIFNDTTIPGSLSWDGFKTQKPIFNIIESADSIITLSVGGTKRPSWNNYTIVNDTTINLSWNANAQNDSVILIWSYHTFSSTLRNDTIYTNSFTFADRSKVLYIGNSSTSFSFEGAPFGENQYFIIYSIKNGQYSSGEILEVILDCPTLNSTPFYENFETYNAFGPGKCWQIMKSDTTGNNLTEVRNTSNYNTWHINNTIYNVSFEQGIEHQGIQSMIVAADDGMLHWLITPEILLPKVEAYIEYDSYFKSTGTDGSKTTEMWVKVFSDNNWYDLLHKKEVSNNLFENKTRLSLNNYLNKNVKIAFVYNSNNLYPLAIDSVAINGSNIVNAKEIQSNTILASPNPAHNYIQLNNLLNSDIIIYNSTGTPVMSILVENSENIDVSHLPKGIYFIKLVSEAQTITGKFIKE